MREFKTIKELQEDINQLMSVDYYGISEKKDNAYGEL